MPHVPIGEVQTGRRQDAVDAVHDGQGGACSTRFVLGDGRVCEKRAISEVVLRQARGKAAFLKVCMPVN
jgi:hypothetical protein